MDFHKLFYKTNDLTFVNLIENKTINKDVDSSVPTYIFSGNTLSMPTKKILG